MTSVILKGPTLGECTGTCGTVLGFLLADTNPKAAGIFLPLAASCLTPLQGSRIHTGFPSHTHIHRQTQMNAG